ncbi:hypothetical protein [Thiomicrorhabdus cannonii]|uniref:hypothetical protein n=1 Tax=Thiomicrorhabdus cannonii TaxID=2748011 RepID=UPI0015C0DFF5|nr:hypothetical protein [Thiomicrorhabdus cannonii]
MKNRTTQTNSAATGLQEQPHSTPPTINNKPKRTWRDVLEPQGNHKGLTVTSERQYRLMLAILEAPKPINALIQIVGANNVPDIVKKLRARGWQIHTLTAPVYDRDGNKVSGGSYVLDKSQLEDAKAALRVYRGAK